MINITKRFPGVLANHSVNFDLKAGEVHALLGENGAGKTTLVNILNGLLQPDEGEIRMGTEKVSINSPRDAARLGIGMVHQHFMLVPTLTVAENMMLMSDSGPFLRTKSMERKISEKSEEFGLKVNPHDLVAHLSEGEKQRVEIVRALYQGARIIILDEPTSVLTPQEVGSLFKIVRALTSSGKSVIFITHKFKEVFAITDRVTVLRQGEVVFTTATENTEQHELARMMVGRDVDFTTNRTQDIIESEILRVDKVTALGDRGVRALDDVDFSLRRGEMLAIAGVAGNGQSELAEVIMGLRKPVAGRVFVGGADVTGNHIAVSKQNVGYVPEERQLWGTLPNLSITENLVLKAHALPPISKRRFFFDSGEAESYAQKLIEEYGIKTPGASFPPRILSGGNLQRLILARELSSNPTLLIAEHPAVGLDVAATEYTRNKLVEAKRNGVGVLLISGDLDEILALSDRVAVMYEGRIMGIVNTPEAKMEQLGLMMAGAQTQETTPGIA